MLRLFRSSASPLSERARAGGGAEIGRERLGWRLLLLYGHVVREGRGVVGKMKVVSGVVY